MSTNQQPFANLSQMLRDSNGNESNSAKNQCQLPQDGELKVHYTVEDLGYLMITGQLTEEQAMQLAGLTQHPTSKSSSPNESSTTHPINLAVPPGE